MKLQLPYSERQKKVVIACLR